MRVFFALLMASFIIPCAAQAQTVNENEKRRYFNSQGQHNAQIYNSIGSSSRGPLSLNQILQGNDNAADGTRNAYSGNYNSRPYGVNGSNKSLALSPSELDETRRRREEIARQQRGYTTSDRN